jgi:HD-like signal output (HDOD) protein
VLKKAVFRAHAGFSPVAVHQPWHFGALSDLPAVPVMPETLLLLDVETQEHSVDLRRVSQLVLGDLGATVQILRLAGREYGDAEGPRRIEDCISDLGVRACMEAMSEQTAVRDSHHDPIARLWAHSREIAQYSKLVAEEMPDVNPEQAYLVGLLHAIESLPAVLGWGLSETGVFDNELTGLKIVREWSFPRFVLEAFDERHPADRANRWAEIVRTAHHCATRSSIDCPFEQEIRPTLYKGIQASFSPHLALTPVFEAAVS